MLEVAWVWVTANAAPIAAVGAAVGGLAGLFALLKRNRSEPTPPPVINVNPTPITPPAREPAQNAPPVEPTIKATFDIAAYEATVQQRIEQLTTQIERAHGAEKELLIRQRDDTQVKLNDIEPAYEQARARIAELETLLEREGNLLGAEDLETAEKALAEGDFDAAEALLARIEDQGDLEVKRTARAAYGRGQIAEEQVRWLDAADHYAKAARLDPTYDTLNKAGHFFFRAGRYPEALRTGQDLLALSKRDHGDTAPETATALNDLAFWHQNLGQYDQAEPLYRQAIEIDKVTIGETHPHYAIRLNNLALLLQAAGRLDEAEPLYRQAIEIDKHALGETHPDYATRLNNLALLLRAAGRLDEAEPLFRQAIEIDRVALGETHPDYAIDLSNLAGLLRAAGRLDEAEPLYRQAIEIDKVTIGETHPAYAIRLNNLALLLRAAGRLDEAEPLNRQAIEIGKATIGETHPDYATHLINLAVLLKDLNRFEEARPLYAQAVQIDLDRLGPEHPQSKRDAGNYAIFLRRHAPDDPALAELQASFGPDIGK